MGAAHSQAALPPTLSLSLVKHLCGNWYSQISVQVEAAFAIRDEIGEITREEFLKIIEPLVVPCDTPIKWDGYAQERLSEASLSHLPHTLVQMEQVLT